jgi:hypothetical protein
MTQSRACLVSTVVIALLFGLEFPDPKLSGEPSPIPYDHTMEIAGVTPDQRQTQTEENADESAKMRNESGAQTDAKASGPKGESNASNDTETVD